MATKGWENVTEADLKTRSPKQRTAESMKQRADDPERESRFENEVAKDVPRIKRDLAAYRERTFQPESGVTVRLVKVRKPKPEHYIGVDPGRFTGVAFWVSPEQKFTLVHTFTIFQALKHIENFIDENHANGGVMLIFEDARKRISLPENKSERAQGAGSVKRDSAIWQEACEMWAKRWPCCFQWRGVAPNGKTNALAKNKALSSQNYGLNYDTSEHARCACGLVWKM